MVIISINQMGMVEVGISPDCSMPSPIETKALMVDADIEKIRRILETVTPDYRVPPNGLAAILFYKQIYQRLNLVERKTFRTFGF